jgi:HSP20 family protein
MTSSPSSSPLDRVRQEVERWVETARITGERALDAVGLASETRPIPPLVDLLETETDLYLFVDLPAVSADGIDLSLAGQVLTLKARRNAPPMLGEGARWLSRERVAATFERTINLPLPVESDSVRAVVRDGLLQVVLKKVPQVLSRTIPIQRSAEAPSG